MYVQSFTVAAAKLSSLSSHRENVKITAQGSNKEAEDIIPSFHPDTISRIKLKILT